MSNKPKFRFNTFAGFTEEWKSNSFSTIAKRVSKQSNSNYLPKLEFEDIISGEGRLNKDISKKFDNRKGIIFEPGYILFGKLRPYLKNWFLPKFNGIALGDFWVFTTKYSPEFVYSLIQTSNFQSVANLSTGTKMPRSDWKTVSTTNFLIPAIEEQKKIGSFFKDLDDTIFLYQQELEVLKQTKQGFLQKMFPKDGENIPKIRFSEFTNDWTCNKLGEICKVTLGQSPNGQNYTDNPNDYILVQGNADIKKGRVHPRVWTTQVTKTANPGDIILCVRAPVGDVAKTSHKVVLGRGVASIKGNEFLYHLLYKMKTGGYWARYSTGSTFESINSTDIKEAVVMLPSEEEQIKIGEFFRQVDEVIHLKEQELEALKQTKQGFLQKMFV